MANTRIKQSLPDRIFTVCNTIFMCLLIFIFLYPLYFVLIASFSAPSEIVGGRVFLYIRGFNLESYKAVFTTKHIWEGYRNTILYTVFGTMFSLFLTIPCAYAMSKKFLPWRPFFSWVFFIPMFFGGGMIPTYLLVRDLNLLDTPFVLIVMSSLSLYNMVVARTFYQSSIPESLYEAARIDGANEIGMFFRIAVPLSAPIIAVMALYYAVSRWNSYFDGLLYVAKKAYEPLQVILRRILVLNQSALDAAMQSGNGQEAMIQIKRRNLAEGMKYALVFISSLPMLIVYPFIQKFFVKGVMVGAIKS